MNPITQEMVDAAFKNLAGFPEGKKFTLEDLLKDEGVWKKNYSKHPGAGRAFYNRLEARQFTLEDGSVVESLDKEVGDKLQPYIKKRG